MGKKITLESWLSPVISHKVEKVGERSHIIVNTTGGMAGGIIHYYGIISSCKRKDFKGFITVTMTEQDKSIDINPTYVRSIEDIIVWKETIVHNNPNYKGDQIHYFATNKHIDDICTCKLFEHENSKKCKDIKVYDIEKV